MGIQNEDDLVVTKVPTRNKVLEDVTWEPERFRAIRTGLSVGAAALIQHPQYSLTGNATILDGFPTVLL